jgi:hypothetical protein
MASPETRDRLLDSKFRGHELVFQVVHDGNNDAGDDDNNNDNSTFTCFPALPAELRLLTWEYLIQPRIVVVAYFNPRREYLERAQLWRQPRKPAIPALLHVNHESRALALRHYEQAFFWKYPGASGRSKDPKNPHAWFNFGLDALYFLGGLDVHGLHGYTNPLVHGFDSNDLGRVRHVATTFKALRNTLHPSDQRYGMLFFTVRSFTSAQRLLIATWPQDAAELTPLPALPTTGGMLLDLWAKFEEGMTCVTSELEGKQMLMLREEDLAGFLAEHR